MKFRNLVLVALAALPLQAGAVVVNITGFTYDTGADPVKSVTVATPGYSGPAGQFSGTIDGDAFTTFCTEIGQAFSLNTPYSYSIIDGSTVVAWQAAGVWGATKFDDLSLAMSAFIATGFPSNATTSAVAQAVIWEILYENSGSYSFASGSFQTTSANAGVSAYLGQFDFFADWSFFQGYELTHRVDQLYSRTEQNFLIARVPEPATLALLGLGLMGIGFARRRKAA